MKNTSAVLLMFTALLLNTCGVRRVPITTAPVWQGTGWTAVERDGKFFVIARNNEATAAAMKQLCSKEYICFGPDSLGEALVIERKHK